MHPAGSFRSRPEIACAGVTWDHTVGAIKGHRHEKRKPVTVKTGDRLGWVESALKTYPPDRFLTGLGMAPDRKLAEQRSLTELEKPFALGITGRTKMQIKAMGAFPESLNR